MALERIDMLLKMYEEHASQAQQNENQRVLMTGIVLTMAGAVLSLITFAKAALYTWPLSLFLVGVGIYGWLFSEKHYERNRLHTTIMRVYRDEIENEMSGSRPNTGSPKTLAQLREDGEREHYDKYPGPQSEYQRKAKSWIARQRLGLFWEGLHLGVVAIGLLLLLFIIYRRDKPDVVRAEVKTVQEFTPK